MSKTRYYFTILIIAVAVAAAGYILNIAAIKSFVSVCLNSASNNILSVSAAVCTFIFLGNKNYWSLLTVCAILASLAVQLLSSGGVGLMTTLAQTICFLGIAFLMNLVRVIVNK